jgi:hypothetical protein
MRDLSARLQDLPPRLDAICLTTAQTLVEAICEQPQLLNPGFGYGPPERGDGCR